MTFYGDRVMDHFLHPRNVGEMQRPDGIGEVGNAVCGDTMRFAIAVREGRITDVKFKTFGCVAAIAVASMVSEMAIGKTLDEALEITNEMVAEELGGLPEHKMHCSNLGADALHAAIEDFHRRNSEGDRAGSGDERPDGAGNTSKAEGGGTGKEVTGGDAADGGGTGHGGLREVESSGAGDSCELKSKGAGGGTDQDG